MTINDCGPDNETAGQPIELLKGMPLWANKMPNCRYEPVNVEPREIPLHTVDFPGAEAFLTYWEDLRADRFAPPWQEFDLMALGGESVSRVLVVDILPEPLRIKYRFWGTANTNAKGIDMTGKYLEDFPLVRRSVAREEYLSVIAERRPMAFTDKLVLPDTDKNDLRLKAAFEQVMIRLPLSNHDESVDHVVSIAHWEKTRPV